MVSIGAVGGIIEGSYTGWTSLGTISVPHQPMGKDDIACLVDCQNHILHTVYYSSVGGIVPYHAIYQLPGKALISELTNHGNLNNAWGYGSAHGAFTKSDTYMLATISGRYSCQVTYDPKVIVTEKGVEIENLTPTFTPYSFYISPKGQYIVITETASPYRIEIFKGA